ncbi:hypothetical protein BDA96_01G577200 [Sorghum bicolor]|uniref:DUF3615 domain-containing protein n=1 Tax=Sorghum bicolor TaxID=4558 RepID=A0A921V2F7_SORBI|nr:hypothetical protein BDA96_01G577200 [Sorghum bicolor]
MLDSIWVHEMPHRSILHVILIQETQTANISCRTVVAIVSRNRFIPLLFYTRRSKSPKPNRFPPNPNQVVSDRFDRSMAPSMEIGIISGAAAADETRHLLGVGPALIGPTPEAAASATRRSSRRACRWLPLRLLARRRDNESTKPTRAVCKPMDAQDFRRHRERRQRVIEQGHFERLAANRQLVMECLRHYNSLHPHDEYEPAPGEVTKHLRAHSIGVWTHGNFVARRKRSGCFSFLPAPRTLFFFELNRTSDFYGVVTCTPLDEPVTEGYSVLGFPIWWGSRRDGRSDCICKTCYRRFDSEHETPACGHGKAERICEMCYHSSAVLHPFPGEFAYGYREYLYRCYY